MVSPSASYPGPVGARFSSAPSAALTAAGAPPVAVPPVTTPPVTTPPATAPPVAAVAAASLLGTAAAPLAAPGVAAGDGFCFGDTVDLPMRRVVRPYVKTLRRFTRSTS